MINIDWSQLQKASDIASLQELARLAPVILAETLWVDSERKYVGEQLEAIEDGEDIPGTEREWRDYRIQVRGWKEGAEGFPETERRPVRPS